MFLPEFIKKTSLLLLFIYSMYSLGITLFSIHNNVIQKDNEYKEKILGLKVEKSQLDEKLSLINSDEFVEKEARTRLNMKKEGEEVYLISSNGVNKTQEVTYTETAPKGIRNLSNFEKWIEILF